MVSLASTLDLPGESRGASVVRTSFHRCDEPPTEPSDMNSAISGADRLRELCFAPLASENSESRVGWDAIFRSLRLTERQRAALRAIDEWYSTPDDRGAAYWDSFEAEISQGRFSLGSIFPEA